MPLQIRRGTEAERQILAVAPAQGELIWITDDRKLYIGDGSALARDLVPVTGFNDDDAVDAVATALSLGTHTNIIFTETAGAINAEVTLSDYTGTLTADAFKGTVVADDSSTLVNAVDGSINLNGTVKGHIIPDANEQYDLGDSLHRFRDLWLSGSSIKLGGATITATGSTVDLPAGSTIGGTSITGELTGDLTGSVFAKDSSIIIDSDDLKLFIPYIETDEINTSSAFLKIGSADDATTKFIQQYAPVAGATRKIDSIVDANDGPGDYVNATRGTLTSPSTVLVNDVIRQDLNFAYDGTSYTIATGITHLVDPNGAVSAGAVPGLLALSTFNDGDGDNPKGILIDSQGQTTINQGLNTARATLDVGGNVIADGTVTAASFKGSLVADDSTTIVDGLTGDLVYNATTAADWSGNAPTTVKDALDRIAAALGPIA